MSDKVPWRILFIDDDEDDYIITRALLKEVQGRRIEVEWACSIEEGQVVFDKGSFDAVLVDYDLGARCGIEFIRENCGRGNPTPLILFTGRGSYEIDVEAMRAGAVLYLTKGEATPLLLERGIRYAIERKQAEQEIKRQARLLAEVHDAILAADTNNRLTYWNKGAERMYGYTEAEALGNKAGGLLQVEYEPGEVEKIIDELNRLGEARFAIRAQRRDGTEIVADVNSARLDDEHGNPSGYIVTHRDITERKHAEERLAFQANILANVTDVVYATDENLHLTSWNHAAEMMYGWKEEDVLGKNIIEVVGSKFDPEMRARLTRELMDKGVVTAEIEHRTRVGKAIFFESNTCFCATAPRSVASCARLS